MVTLTLKALRLALVMAVALCAAQSSAAGPGDQVSLNAKGQPMPAEDWLALISREAKAPVVLVGPAGGRRAAYAFDDERLGDVLDDLSSFYGWSWKAKSGVIAISSTLRSRGMPPRLAEWVERRCRAARATAGLQELLILCRYPDTVLAEVVRYWAPAQVLAESPEPYRLIATLTAAQRARAESVGLSKDQLTEAQVGLVESALKRGSGPSAWPDGWLLWYGTTASASAASREIVRLDLRSASGGQVGVFTYLIDHHDPVYAEFPPAAEQEQAAGKCEIAGDPRNGLTIELRSAPLKQVLERLSSVVGGRRSAAGALQGLPVTAFGTAADVAAFVEALASAADGKWETAADGGSVLVPNAAPRSKPQAPQTPGALVRELFWAVSQSEAERAMLSACDYGISAHVGSYTWRYWAVRLLQLVDPAAPDGADRPGEMRLAGASLPADAIDCLLNVSKRLLWAETMQPVYDRALLADPDTSITFTWDGSGDYKLEVGNPGLAPDQRVECDFGVSAMHARPLPVLDHFPEQPWFLKLPKDVPKEYLEYLDRTRAWRGRLALKHVAPLAFVPEAKWQTIRKRVPEFATVTRKNRRAVQYYAVLDHRLRSAAQGNGIALKESAEWTETQLLRAIHWQAQLKRAPWTPRDRMLLRTDRGIVRSLDFTIGTAVLRFSVPGAEDLLGEEGCGSRAARQ